MQSLLRLPRPIFVPIGLIRARRPTYPNPNQPTALLPRSLVVSSSSSSTMASTTLARAVGKLQPVSTTFLLCDIQERFRDVIWHFPQVIRTAQLMTAVGKHLQIPTLATEQYPKAFGATVPELDVTNAEYPIATFEKKLFSMITDEVKAKMAETPERKTFVLFGIEAHVCVQQTALDLLEQGYAVHVLVDGVSSQRAHDRAVALRRMEKAGAYLTTAESLVFMLLGGASHPQFRTIATLIKEHAAGATSPFEELLKTNVAL